MSAVLLGMTSPWASDGSELRDGNAVALRIGAAGDTKAHAATEERLSGWRYDPHVALSVRRVLARVGAQPDDELHVAVSSALGPLNTPEQARLIAEKASGTTPATVSVIDHHVSHALETFAPSGLAEAVVLVIDSAGNQIRSPSGAWGWETQTSYRARRLASGRITLDLLHRDFFDHPGYGQLFRAVTRYVGFPGYHHASKIMAFAGIGHDREISLPAPHQWGDDDIPRLGWRLQPEDPVGSLSQWLGSLGFADEGPRSESWYLAGSDRVNGRSSLRATDIELSAWVQRGWVDMLRERSRKLATETGLSDFCLGGGVALNCVANAELLAAPWVRSVHVGTAPGDHGQGLGNLYALVNEHAPELSHLVKPPYFGRSESPEAPSWLLQSAQDVGAELAAGRIAAVCRGTAEFGPRALGHRSLLCRATKDVTERLRVLKRREDYQPFAVAVTQEYAAEHLDRLDSPYMSFAPHVVGRSVDDLADVVHDDGTCRIQTLSQRSDPWLHAVLTSMAEHGLPPVAVNTSLNHRGDPMIDQVLSQEELRSAFNADLAIVDSGDR